MQELLVTTFDLRNAAPNLFETTGSAWLSNNELGEEVFGPQGIMVRAQDFNEMVEIAKNLTGQLTCALHLDVDADTDAKRLMLIFES